MIDVLRTYFVMWCLWGLTKAGYLRKSPEPSIQEVIEEVGTEQLPPELEEYSEVVASLESRYKTQVARINELYAKALEGYPEADDISVKAIDVKPLFNVAMAEDTVFTPYHDVRITQNMSMEEELGQPGTPWATGIVQIEQNGELEPWTARGLAHDTGVFADLRNTPIVEQSLMRPVRAIAAMDWRVVPKPLKPWDDATTAEKHFRLIEAVVERWGQYEITRYVEELLLTVPPEGFCLWEKVWTKDTLNIGYGFKTYRVPEIPSIRLPNSVEYWVTDSKERLQSVIFRYDHVTSFSGEQSPARVMIPRYRLIHIANRQLGSNYEGRSALRACYSQILMLRALQQLQMLASEINGLGDMVVTLPPRMSNTDKQALQQHLANVVARLVPYTILPNGTSFTRTSPNSTLPDFDPQIRALKEDIALALDNTGELIGLMHSAGSFALKETASEEAASSLDYIARVLVSGPLESQLFREILELNFPNDPVYYVPDFVCGNLSERDTGKWIENISTANGKTGVLYNDDPIGRAVRRALDLPEELKDSQEYESNNPDIEQLKELLKVLPVDASVDSREKVVRVVGKTLEDIVPRLSNAELEQVRVILSDYFEKLDFGEASKIVGRVISTVKGEFKETSNV